MRLHINKLCTIGGIMRYLKLLLISILITSCADSHQILRTTNKSIKLNTSAPAYISIPKDGRYGQTTYAGSGATVSQVILLAFSKHLTQVETGHQYQSFKDAIKYAKENKFEYLIFPSVLEWEDRATEWSGIPDKASIKISIIKVSTSKTLDSAIIKGESGLGTFGGDHPQDLLPKPVGDYVNKLF